MPNPSTSTWIAFVLLLTASMLLLGAVLLPLWQPLFMGTVLAGALQPWHERLSARLGRRSSLAAALLILALLTLVILPLAALGSFAVREATLGVLFMRETLATGGVAGL